VLLVWCGDLLLWAIVLPHRHASVCTHVSLLHSRTHLYGRCTLQLVDSCTAAYYQAWRSSCILEMMAVGI
jgi:hypothetical protein